MDQMVDVFDTEAMVPGFSAPVLPSGPFDPAAVQAADKISRYWTSDAVGPFKVGSEIHKREVCRMFRETFNPYRPSVLEWPDLSPEELQRITALPIWDIAVETEGKARLRMAAYAKTVADKDMRLAVAQNAWEENRHKEVLSKMVTHYGIPLAKEPPYIYPTDAEWAYMVTGYSECIDSFFAFGLFKVAQRSGLFPQELIDTFEPVMQEECRHILLFANWVAWHRKNMPWWRRPWFELKVFRVYCFLAYERIGLARSLDGDGNERTQDNNFTVNGAQSMTADDLSLPELLQLCLDEDEFRFSGYDKRLLRPTTMPTLVRFALKFMKKKKKA
ncbi:ferritin-like domain-containing protein [Frateuria aurantia]